MAEPSGSKPPRDPMDAWREMRDAGLDAWSKAMVEAVNSEEYARASGALLDSYLTASAPFRELMQKALTQTLQQLNLPTRSDFASLAERLTNIEMRLDDLDSKLDVLMTRRRERPAAGQPRKKERR